MSIAEKTTRKQRGKPFAKGTSGNPTGRPAGSRNRTALAMEALLDGEAEKITRKAIEKALDGDITALRLCLERILPPRRDRSVTFHLPPIQTVAAAAIASGAILQAAAAGDITTSEAADLGKVLETHVRTLTAGDIETRVAALEQRTAAR